MSRSRPRPGALPALALALALAAAAMLPVLRSDASFNSVTSNTANLVAADRASNYVRLYSQGSDPAGLTGYALKLSAVPAQPAATGTNETLGAQLGRYKNANDVAATRVFTLQAPSPLPPGASPVTVSVALTPDPATGRQPLKSFTLSNLDGSGAAATTTLTAGVKKQLNVVVNTQGFPGNGVLYQPSMTLTLTYPGYAGSFLTYVVPFTVWDGNGSGP